MRIVETHAHLDSDAFDDDRERVIARARDAGVEGFINVALDPDAAERTLDLTATHDATYAAIGIHPHRAGAYAGGVPAAVERLRALCARPRVVAAGEMGLDYHRDYAPARAQRDVFSAQVELAEETGLPVIIHCRAAEAEVLERLAPAALTTVVMHCFSGDAQAARECARRGYYIGVGGVLTFPNAGRLRSIVREYPRERVLLETDCPFLAPQPRRGRRNEPAYLVWVAEALAQCWDVSPQEAAAATAENARRALGLPGAGGDGVR